MTVPATAPSSSQTSLLRRTARWIAIALLVGAPLLLASCLDAPASPAAPTVRLSSAGERTHWSSEQAMDQRRSR
jgi:hypothetical protein